MGIDLKHSNYLAIELRYFIFLGSDIFMMLEPLLLPVEGYW